MSDATFGALIIIGIILAACLYCLPTLIAFNRGHAYRWPIFGLNLFLGASGLGWLIALVWAMYPQNRSLADPILGNPTGTGTRNVGDTLGEMRASMSPSEAAGPRSERSVAAMDALSKLATLAEKGRITDEEFNTKKAELLSQI